MIRKETQQKGETGAAKTASEEVIYKIDIPANRYDMLCVEGIARALNVFKHGASVPRFRLADMAGRSCCKICSAKKSWVRRLFILTQLQLAAGKPLQRMIVKPETALVRPFVVCAILRGCTFDAARYNSFIDLQDKLHQNLCRQRTLVAIGTHDLATIKVRTCSQQQLHHLLPCK